jgi:hypothetical protein
VTIKSELLPHVLDCLNASIVEFKKSAGNLNVNISYSSRLWLIGTSKGSSKERTVKIMAFCIIDVEKRIAFKKVGVEDLVTVLLVNIPTLEFYYTKVYFKFQCLN